MFVNSDFSDLLRHFNAGAAPTDRRHAPCMGAAVLRPSAAVLRPSAAVLRPSAAVLRPSAPHPLPRPLYGRSGAALLRSGAAPLLPPVTVARPHH